MRRGFTLVELSIVLVIIGLLIGGILVAQSMISTAKIQGYIRSLQQYEIAIRNFKTTYNSLPGDSRHFVPAGNGNGSLDYNSGIQCAVAPNDTKYSSFETNHVWAHLSQSKMIKGNYVPYEPGNDIYACPGGTHDGSVKGWDKHAGLVGPVFAENTRLDKLWGPGVYHGKNIGVSYGISVLRPYPGYTLPPVNAFMSHLEPYEFISIDTKMDDGISDKGNVIGMESIYEQGYCDNYMNNISPSNRATYPAETMCLFEWLTPSM